MKFFLKHTRFIVLLAALGVVYISNAHHAERKLRVINKLQKEVADAKAKYQKVKSEINYESTESQMARALNKKGLKRNTTAPVLLNSKGS